MSEWQRVKLGEVIIFNPKESIPKGTIAKKVAMEQLATFTRKIQGFESTEFKGGSKFRNGDTLLARITPCLENGKTAQVTILDEGEVAFGSTEYIVMRERENISDNSFIYYLSISPFLRDIAIKSMVGSSGRQRVQQSVLEEKEIPLPPLDEQKRIAQILSSLDDKIENNNAINKNLEEQAQAIFKSWFVDFEANETVSLKEYIELNPKITLKKGTITSSIEMKDLSTSTMSVSTSEKKAYNGGSKFYNDDTLLARITPCLENGKTAFVDFLETEEIGFGSTEFIVMQAKKIVSPYYVYCLARYEDFRSYAIKSMVGSSGRQRVQSDVLENYELPKVPDSLFENFTDTVKPLFRQIRINTIENQKLSQLRDTLLPKLMSGELRV